MAILSVVPSRSARTFAGDLARVPLARWYPHRTVAMDFFKKVGAQVGDVAGAMGGLLLGSDSDTDEDRDEHAAATRARRDADPDAASTRDDHTRDGPVSRDPTRVPADGSEDAPDGSEYGSDGSEYGDDEPLIPDAVWGALAAAKDRVAAAAKTTVESVRRDVTAAAETVRRDLGEFNDVVESDVVFVGDAVSEYTAGVDARDSDDVQLDEDVAEAFERGADVLEDVGARVERIGADVFRKTGALFNKIKDELLADSDDDDDVGRGGDGGLAASRAARFASRRAGGAAARAAAARARIASGAGSSSRVSGTGSSSRAGASASSSASAAISAPTFEQRVSAMQRDSDTYCEDPEDAAAFAAFVREFDLDAAKTEVDAILASNSFMRTMSERIVPVVVEYDAFWTRYFFRLRALERECRAKEPEEAEREANDAEKEGAVEDKGTVEEKGADEKEGAVEEKGADEKDAEASRDADAANASPEASGPSGADTTDAAPHARHNSVVSLYTDEDAIESDDSLAKEWTAVREDAGEKQRDAAASSASSAEKPRNDAAKPDANDAEDENDDATKEIAGADPAGDSDIDEDWGMESD